MNLLVPILAEGYHAMEDITARYYRGGGDPDLTLLISIPVDDPWSTRHHTEGTDLTWLTSIGSDGIGDHRAEVQEFLWSVREFLNEIPSHVIDRPTRYALNQAFLPIVKEFDWLQASDDARQRSPVRSPEWVTTTRWETGIGLALPDDASPRAKLSLFTKAEGYRTVDIAWEDEYMVTAHRQVHHCPRPERAYCPSPGSCGGRCLSYEVVESRGRGLICLCEHGR